MSTDKGIGPDTDLVGFDVLTFVTDFIESEFIFLSMVLN